MSKQKDNSQKDKPNKTFSILKPYEDDYNKILGFDIETEGPENNFVLGCFYGDDLKYVARTKQEVIDFVNERRLRNYTIFATNLAFDFLGSFYEETDFWDFSERNGCIYSFKWYQQKTIVDGAIHLKYPVHFYDTLKIFPASVAKLGSILNVPKMEHPSCFAKIPQNAKEELELIEYCMNDAKISYLFIKQVAIPFLQKYNLKFGPTIGNIAVKDFRTNHLKQTFYPEPKINHEMAFKSYYGGRTETFKRGTFKNVYCFDINSLYPSVMLEDMPDPNTSYYNELGDMYHIENMEGVSFVKVHVPDMYMPPLPMHKDDKLLFPIGTFTGFYNHNELRNAMKYGVTILDIKEQLVYPKKLKLFNSFIEEHYAERLKLQATKDPLEVMEKLIMNNLYGKFAFNYSKSTELIPAHKFDYNKISNKVIKVTPLFNDKFISLEKEGGDPPVYSFPIWSSYITSYSRIKMYEYLANPDLKDKLISTDTDSIFLKDYNGEIPTSTKLGEMKLEDGYPIAVGIFVRPKMYFTHKPKCKGISFSHENGEAEFYKILNGGKVKQRRFVKFRTAIRSQSHHKFGIVKPNQIIHTFKKCDLEDTKRAWSKRFNINEEQDSRPLEVNE